MTLLIMQYSLSCTNILVLFTHSEMLGLQIYFCFPVAVGQVQTVLVARSVHDLPRDLSVLRKT